MEGDKNMERDSLWERAICLEKRVTALEEAHLRESARRSSCETYKSDFRRSLESHGPFGSAVDGIGRGSSGNTGTFIGNWSQPFGIARFEEFDREKAAIRLEMMAITEAANRFVEIARKEENNRLAEIARKEEADRLAEIARKEKVAEKEDAGSPDIGGQEDSMAPSKTVRLVQEAWQKKEKTIETNHLALETEFHAHTRSITQRRRCHQALDEGCEKGWRVVRTARINTTKSRLDEHTARISRGKKRTEIFCDQLDRQKKSKRMLLFKRAALTDERKADCKLFDEHREDCKKTLDEARHALTITPEYVNQLEADMKVRASELQAVKASKKRVHQEGGDAQVDERDAFMNEVRRRRAKFQKKLDDQAAQLEAENKLRTSPLERMNQHIKNLEEEVKNAAKEERKITQFHMLIDTETKLLADEETKQEEKKRQIMNEAGNWVFDSLHVHSNRKKVEANRLVKKAVRVADLQKREQHFARRVVDQEEQIMRQKQRILNGEHKVEMLKWSENWYQCVTEKSKDATSDQKESLSFKDHQRPEMVVDIYKLRARGRENQVLMDELANVGEHEVFLGSSGKGTSHFRAAREFQLADQVIKSGATAWTSVPLVCDLMTDEHGRIVKNSVKTTRSNSFSRGSGGGYTQAYIVNDLREESVVCQEKQFIVDVSIDYGDSHVYSGYQDKGIPRLRATQHIWDSKTVVKSGQQASKEIDVVGQRVAANVDQGHADRDEDCGYDTRNQEMEEVTVSRDITKNEAQAWKRKVEVSQKLADGLKEIHVENAINLMEPRDRDKRQVMVFKQAWNVNEMSNIKVEGDFRSGYEADFITDAVDGRDAWRLKEVFPEFIVETKTHIPLWIY